MQSERPRRPVPLRVYMVERTAAKPVTMRVPFFLYTVGAVYTRRERSPTSEPTPAAGAGDPPVAGDAAAPGARPNVKRHPARGRGTTATSSLSTPDRDHSPRVAGRSPRWGRHAPGPTHRAVDVTAEDRPAPSLSTPSASPRRASRTAFLGGGDGRARRRRTGRSDMIIVRLEEKIRAMRRRRAQERLDPRRRPSIGTQGPAATLAPSRGHTRASCRAPPGFPLYMVGRNADGQYPCGLTVFSV